MALGGVKSLAISIFREGSDWHLDASKSIWMVANGADVLHPGLVSVSKGQGRTSAIVSLPCQGVCSPASGQRQRLRLVGNEEPCRAVDARQGERT